MTIDTRDQVAAQRFGRRRLRSALLTGDPDGSTAAFGRLGAGAYGGILVTMVVLAVAGLVGVLRPGDSTAWQEPGAFIVDGDTGGRYLVRDGVLHPVLNYASARLLLGDALHVVTVSGSSLKDAARGPTLGIPSAPDALPDPGHIVGTDWSVCAVGRAVGGDRLTTRIRPGAAASGIVPSPEQGVLVRTERDRTVLLWSGAAYPVPERWRPALRYQDARPLPVTEEFVAALPAGAPLAPPAVAGLGEAGPPLPGSTQPTVVGTIYGDRNANAYLMTPTGLAALTAVQAQLLLADPGLATAYGGGDPSPLKVTQAQVTEAAPALLTDPAVAAGTVAAAPATVPALVDPAPGEQQFCIRWAGAAAPDLVVGPAEPTPATGSGPVVLAPGQGALVAARPDPAGRDPGTGTGAGSSATLFLVTDRGVRYPLAGRPELDSLGLSGAPVAELPVEVLDALPVGVTLDRAAAAAPAT
ncbi:type VII secretion protein EccB [Nakamurella sp.]|uniref:type VII secretion protein EccB n=1 Tax=Nakamurella sp. TaxID=1869182 RepID=UPI003B3A3FF0